MFRCDCCVVWAWNIKCTREQLRLINTTWYKQCFNHYLLNYITLPTRVRLVKAMVFSVAMYGCES